MKRTALLAGGALAIVAFVLGLRSAGKADAGGFLGPASLLSDINLTLEILLVVGLTFGMTLARSERIEAHRVNQTVWVLVNAALTLCIMIPSLQNAKPRTFADLAKVSTGLPLLHAAIGVLTLAAGLWLVLQMNDVLPQRGHLGRWKTLMRGSRSPATGWSRCSASAFITYGTSADRRRVADHVLMSLRFACTFIRIPSPMNKLTSAVPP